jgi:D-alanyl-lipoteichoic acid acyltransferase DltB (MBOAT superfamily)
MLFNSELFIFVFLPCVAGIFYGLHARKLDHFALWWLLAASLAFYACWKPEHLGVLLSSIGMNLGFARWIEARSSRASLWCAVFANLGLLAAFKYSGFALNNLAVIGGYPATFRSPELPLGISFFTFTQIAFLVDLAQGRARRTTPSQYGLFVTFFPHLIAGPLFRYDEIIPQLKQLGRQVSWTAASAGLAFFAIGLFKKVVIADTLAQVARPVFDGASAAGAISGKNAWTGALAYTGQLYFDFSGYSDMAIGLGLMFGIRMPFNFDSPYKATSIISFWQRWHITLSRFLRDYLYFPLGGNRRGPIRRYANLMIVMLLGGLWHGAGWTFVLWGALHGLFLCVNHGWRALAIPARSPWLRLAAVPAAWALTFVCVVAGWVLFRSPDVATAATLLGAMAMPAELVGGQRPPPVAWPEIAGGPARWIAASLLLAVLFPNSQTLVGWMSKVFAARRWMPVAAASAIVALLAIAITMLDRPTEFIYFQF